MLPAAAQGGQVVAGPPFQDLAVDTEKPLTETRKTCVS